MFLLGAQPCFSAWSLGWTGSEREAAVYEQLKSMKG